MQHHFVVKIVHVLEAIPESNKDIYFGMNIEVQCRFIIYSFGDRCVPLYAAKQSIMDVHFVGFY